MSLAEVGDWVVIRSSQSDSQPNNQQNNQQNKQLNKPLKGEILAIEQNKLLLQLPYGRGTIERKERFWQISNQLTVPLTNVTLIKSNSIPFAQTEDLDNVKLYFLNGECHYYIKVGNYYYPNVGLRRASGLELISLNVSGTLFQIKHSTIGVKVEFTKSYNRISPEENPLNQFDYGFIMNPHNKEVILEFISERYYYLFYLQLLYKGYSKFEIENWTGTREIEEAIERLYSRIVQEIEQTGSLHPLSDEDYLY
jgi:hypothetical protein